MLVNDPLATTGNRHQLRAYGSKTGGHTGGWPHFTRPCSAIGLPGVRGATPGPPPAEFHDQGRGADPGAVGLIIDIDMTRTEVMWVMPPAFVFGAGTALRWPLPFDQRRRNWVTFFYRGVARLADGITAATGPVTNAAHRSISPRRWSNRSLRA